MESSVELYDVLPVHFFARTPVDVLIPDRREVAAIEHVQR